MSFPTRSNGEVIDASHMNDVQDAIEALQAAGSGVNPAVLNGFLEWTFDPALSSNFGKQINSVGTLHLTKFIAYASHNVSNVAFYVQSVGSTSTCRVALYSSAGALLKQSTSAVSTTTTGLKTCALTATQALVAGTIYYAAVWCVSGSGQAPSLSASENAQTGGNGSLSSSIGLAAPNLRSATADTSLGASAPANFGTQSSLDPMVWFGLT